MDLNDKFNHSDIVKKGYTRLCSYCRGLDLVEGFWKCEKDSCFINSFLIKRLSQLRSGNGKKD